MSENCPICNNPLPAGAAACPNCGFKLLGSTLIAPENGKYLISDSNSYNGVWINNKSVDSAILHDGDIIQIGVFCLLYQESPEA